MPRVLVVDDDPTVGEVVQRYLELAGHEVLRAADGLSALAAASERRPDLVVLDVMLPGLDGIEVCRRLRATSDVPVVMLTALGGEVDRVLGLEVGADDYVTKPFSARELVLRVQSVLRRAIALDASGAPGGGAAAAPPASVADGAGTDSPGAPGTGRPPSADAARVLRSGALLVDTAARTVTRDGRPVSLTLREFDLLVHFLRHPGRAYTREELLSQVWGWDFGDHSTVTVHVRRLRNKVEPDPADPAMLVTVWGVGYRWDGHLAATAAPVGGGAA